MSITTHNLGFPRIGANRELKRALENYWAGNINQQELYELGRTLRAAHWKLQSEVGIDLIPVGDFAWYDQVLTTAAMLGALPQRHCPEGETITIDNLFLAARGTAPGKQPTNACQMTKWFNSNYHYIVPELSADQQFSLAWEQLFDELSEAIELGYRAKPVIVGPLTFLWLSKCAGEAFNKLDLLNRLLPVYAAILDRIAQSGTQWVQIDEPILALDLPTEWKQAFENSYHSLQRKDLNIMVASYFGGLGDNAYTATRLPVAGLHVDGVNAPRELSYLADQLPVHKVLSVGVVNGRNIWRNNLDASVDTLKPLHKKLGERLWVAPSCSLLHCPVDLDGETAIDPELRSWLAFAKQKLLEVNGIRQILDDNQIAVDELLAASRRAQTSRQQSSRVHNPDVQRRLQSLNNTLLQRSQPHPERAQIQQQKLQLPAFPTTTIGSFPQTALIRQARRDYRNGELQEEEYQKVMEAEICNAIHKQEQMDIDLLVHGEAERNDMVEYFGELLQGYAFTANGWVQSYGSRCVKPPIIYGDISRPEAMTVRWSQYAQSLTKRPVKGMLTGPVTMLQWSFPREDIAPETCALQIAFALRDEIDDLQQAGIQAVQLDEPALREGLPLRKAQWQQYLDWAVSAFRLATAVATTDTQVHTHMCYSEFNDIIDAITALDADVITIETARSAMKLLDAFEHDTYPNQIGPGVYDIHSPNLPTVDAMYDLLCKAVQRIPAEQLWVNPDCGLKTRNWNEVEQALKKMVLAAKLARENLVLSRQKASA